MIKIGDEINKEHTVENIMPEYEIMLPLKDNENIVLDNVTCVYSYYIVPGQLACHDIKYFKKTNTVKIAKEHDAKFIHIYKGKPFDIKKKKKELIKH